MEADLFLCLGSTHLRSPACSALPGGSPELARLGQVLTLLQQLLPDVARNQRVAVLVHTVPEVLTRHANA